MKKWYSRLLLFLFILGTSMFSNAQVYWASLSGPAEAPPNSSPGTGTALLTINVPANTMRIQTSFSGLLAGVTASHIHAPTAVAGTGTAGVATTLPTFLGFPAGVTSGSYDQTFNMLAASSYNPTYVANNGGTTASAFAALRAAITAGKAYLNIHSTMFPGGEIRGFWAECPPISVTIPDAFALPSGTSPNTVYPAYAPASSLTLQANVSGGMSPYSYTWSNSATTSSITVSPTATTTYNLTVRDSRGCPGTASKPVNVVDISGGKNSDKINICHKNNSLTIGSSGVADHLQHGDMLGSCVGSSIMVQSSEAHESNLKVTVMGNPTTSQFELQVGSKIDGKIQINVYDNMGRVIETRSSLPANFNMKLGSGYRAGIYLVEVIQGTQKQSFKLVKSH